MIGRPLTAMCLVLLLAVPGVAMAAPVIYELPEERSELRPGPGVDVVQGNCVSCHSADYITTQPPRVGELFWRTEVTKMIKLYHAPIAEADVGAIVEYLERTH